jgi:hypothetical protein
MNQQLTFFGAPTEAPTSRQLTTLQSDALTAAIKQAAREVEEFTSEDVIRRFPGTFPSHLTHRIDRFLTDAQRDGLIIRTTRTSASNRRARIWLSLMFNKQTKRN